VIGASSNSIFHVQNLDSSSRAQALTRHLGLLENLDCNMSVPSGQRTLWQQSQAISSKKMKDKELS
jgi:hypothetical protein